MGRIKRIINVRFQLDGLHFDAAIDPDWDLHAYSAFMDERDMTVERLQSKTPIEIYCFDHPEWDILMLYQTKEDVNANPVNEQQNSVKTRMLDITLHTACNFDKIIEETKKWIEKNKG